MTRATRAALLVLAFALAMPVRADWVVQVAAIADSAFLRQMSESIRKAGFPVTTESVERQGSTGLKRLLVGPYETKAEAERAAKALAKNGWPGYLRQRKENEKGKEKEKEISSKVNTGEAPAAPKAKPAPTPAPVAAPPPPARETVDPTPDSPSKKSSAPVEETPTEPQTTEPAPQSLESFLAEQQKKSPAKAGAAPGAVALHGFFQMEGAYATPDPSHWTKFRNTLEASLSGKAGDAFGWRIGGRGVYDAIYDLTDFYPENVKRDQRLEATFRETYVDISAGDFDFRLGAQNVVWGEVVGLFFADVVSAKDFRDFVVRDFDLLRLPQWTVRAEWTKKDVHLEGIWIPYHTVNDIGVPGSEFYPAVPPVPDGAATVILDEVRPAHTLANSAFGGRVSVLAKGWDLAAFYYDSVDAAPAFFRTILPGPVPTFVYEPRHERIHQLGLTLTKDFGSFVLKGEGVYTLDRLYPVSRPTEPTGLVPQDAVDYTVGVDVPVGETRFNVQFFQRIFTDRDPDNFLPSVDSGVTADVQTKLFGGKVDVELLYIRSLNDEGWLARGKVGWSFADGFRFAAGYDAFGGPPHGFFGQYASNDRAFAELRFSF